MHVNVLTSCMSVYDVYDMSVYDGALGVQKQGSDPLELDLQMVMSHYVAAGN